MIREFHINNFKSLVNFQFQLDKFTCLIGLNGSGKSTILQALDFTTQLIKGHIEDWLKSYYSWRSEFNANTLTCPNEEIVNDTSGEILFKVADRAYHIGNNPLKPIEFKYQGSLLSILQDEAKKVVKKRPTSTKRPTFWVKLPRRFACHSLALVFLRFRHKEKS
ncbi:SMC domain-containing protein [Candidatus Thiomargarita nelsonii]|uniref:SMC domain-containing protein n=1 Tax=Candidatus Thiomargarita nelsonii TaxID=1003181 RepID=A0A176S274_9GAMM|nr:SMC domain-containing protein [Candidatus Thiomargarita nelsonii]